MKIKAKMENDWKERIRIYDDPYSKAVIDYAINWANLMEKRMANGEKLENVADETSHEADIDGITGFMYGAAVAELSRHWEYGEQLRVWHNLSVQIRDEGEKANETGGVLNPAIMTIESK